LEEEQMLKYDPRPARRSRRRTLVLLACPALAAAALLAGATGAAATATADPAETAERRTPTVNQTLVARLKANRGRGVTAIVTTWSRAGLSAVTALGVRGTTLKSLPMLITPSLTLAQLRRLERSPAVRSIWPQQTYRVFMEDST
jgi:hypothetical protein